MNMGIENNVGKLCFSKYVPLTLIKVKIQISYNNKIIIILIIASPWGRIWQGVVEQSIYGTLGKQYQVLPSLLHTSGFPVSMIKRCRQKRKAGRLYSGHSQVCFNQTSHYPK